MTREVLEQWLRNIGLLSGCIKTYFSEDILDVLYDRLKNPDNYPMAEYKSNFQKKVDVFFGKTAVQTQLNRVSILHSTPRPLLARKTSARQVSAADSTTGTDLNKLLNEKF